MTATVTFRTTPELKSRVDFLTKETRRPSSFYFNLLLEEHLEDLEDIYLSEKILQDIRSGKEKTYFEQAVDTECWTEDDWKKLLPWNIKITSFEPKGSWISPRGVLN